MKVQFSDVGRSKQSWTDEFEEPLTRSAMVSSIRKRGAVASRGIDVEETSEGEGMILVGGFRKVGTWQVVR